MSVNTLESIAGYPISPKDEEGVQKDNESLQMIESVCITWFTIEYILRLAGNCLQIVKYRHLIVLLSHFYISMLILYL